MYGRSYKIGRHMGRMGMDSRQRMSNRAEVGFGMVVVSSMIVLFLMAVAFFL